MVQNSERLSLAAEKLYKLAVGSNRSSARVQGFCNDRFASKAEPTKKQALHLNLQRSKHL